MTYVTIYDILNNKILHKVKINTILNNTSV